MRRMTDVSIPTLTREEILESFIREAEDDTAQVLKVSTLLAEFHSLKEKLLGCYEELVQVHGSAIERPHVKAKLAELGLPEPSTLKVSLPVGQSKSRGAKRGRSARRQGKAGVAVAEPAAARAGAPGSATAVAS
ncbi:hypothetical protein EB74_15145 [Mycobacterium sp. SWH-M5]|nr:hypothetical protein EB74_15145 [Mycobacterium sp. SWH-M5]